MMRRKNGASWRLTWILFQKYIFGPRNITEILVLITLNHWYVKFIVHLLAMAKLNIPVYESNLKLISFQKNMCSVMVRDWEKYAEHDKKLKEKNATQTN